MKHLILCEGKNDSILLEELLALKKDKLHKFEKKKIEKKGGESIVIRDFLDNTPYFTDECFLIKVEDGKTEVKKYFKKFSRQLNSCGNLIAFGIIDEDNEKSSILFEDMGNHFQANKLYTHKEKKSHSIIFRGSGNKEFILFVIPDTLENWVKKSFGTVNPDNIRKLAKKDAGWIIELKELLLREH